MHLLYWCMNLETWHDKNRFYKLLKKVKSKNFCGKILKAGDINTNFKTILYASTLLVYEFKNLARQEYILKIIKKLISKNLFGKILKAGDINTNFKTILYASTLLVYEFRNSARQD